MKRKGFQEIEEDFSSPPFNSHPAKSRRLDGELMHSLEENPGFHCEEVMGECLELEPVNGVLPAEASATGEAMPLGDNRNEKAIVLYQPPLLPRSPSSSEFSIVLNSNLIPGLRDRFFWRGNQQEDKSVEDKQAAEKSNRTSNDSLAVIPWIAPQPLMNTVANGQPTVSSEAMDAEDTDMMDADESPDCYSVPVQDSGVGRTAEGNESQHQLQQQLQLQQWMMLPGVIQNISTPITW